MLDLVLAVLHHLLILSMAGLLAAELALVRPGVGGASLKTLAVIDAGYGATATLVLVVGACRVSFGAKGAAFYLENPVFWAKIAAFAVVGVLSAWPTIAPDDGVGTGRLRPDPDLRRRHGAWLRPLAPSKPPAGPALENGAGTEGKRDLKIYG
jgi:uncharacterized membrane protein